MSDVTVQNITAEAKKPDPVKVEPAAEVVATPVSEPPSTT